ncbi:putative transmembrane emp24 domain-containing protein 2 [Blattamonas nauphoetae]|uniref:Transmembrane emp24 domain-containing protein 2 n=1 Tax=Blattamonas nauphoetae TaxID=2049346 RepID=A0ABQ9Y4U2_9EUKA|nr:putative transmembrane emp24 domain-containing protein 2 [Blattamonas nauphoetae]
MISFLICLFAPLFSLTYTLDGNTDMCFFEELDKGVTTRGHFQVIRGGDRKVNLIVTDPKERSILKYVQESETRFSFTASEEGIYKFCMKNPSGSRKEFSLLTESFKAGEAEVGSLKANLDNLQITLNSILNEQNYVKKNERTVSLIADKTNKQVVFWSIVQISTVILTTVGQYFFFQRIFKN